MRPPDLAVGGIRHQQLARGVGVDDADRRGVEQHVEPARAFVGAPRRGQRCALALDARLLGVLAFGDVDGDAGEAAAPGVRIGEHLAARVDPHVLAGALRDPVFDVVQGLGQDGAVDRGQHGRAVLGVDHVGKAHQLGALAGERGVDLEQAREALVHIRGGGVEVVGPGADVARGFERQGEVLFRLLVPGQRAHLVADFDDRAQQAAHQALVVAHRAVGKGEPGLLAVAMALHRGGIVLEEEGLAGQHAIGILADRVPHLVPDLGQRPAERVGGLVAEQGQVGIVVEQFQPRAPGEEGRERRSQHDAEGGAQGRRPGGNRSERVRVPVVRVDPGT